MHPRPTVVHLPHASRLVPSEHREALLLSEAALEHELLLMTDAFTDELFDVDGTAVIRFPISRLVVDPERFTDDAHEPMSSRGMGAIYTKRASGERLREAPSNIERAHLLETWYTPHHSRLTRAVDDALGGHNTCLVLDAHSFPSRPLPYEIDQEKDRPEICLGSDDFHTPVGLLDFAVTVFTQAGYSVQVNRPFSGALVPLVHYQREQRVHALMMEVRRDLYMNEQTGERRADFADVANHVQHVLGKLIAFAG